MTVHQELATRPTHATRSQRTPPVRPAFAANARAQGSASSATAGRDYRFGSVPVQPDVVGPAPDSHREARHERRAGHDLIRRHDLGEVFERADGVGSAAAILPAKAEDDGACAECDADETSPTVNPRPPTTTTRPTGTAAGPGTGTGTAVPCAQPVNWTHTGARDFGPDAIRIDITWASSTGNLADLSNCTVREVVNYDPIPNPPFLWNPPNPTILTVAGTLGAGMDTHSYPLGLKTGITDPREAGTMTAHQTYQFRCTGPGCSGSWTDFPGQTYDITREVFAQYVWLNPWRYEITKTGTGTGNTFKYSRQVEIPEP